MYSTLAIVIVVSVLSVMPRARPFGSRLTQHSALNGCAGPRPPPVELFHHGRKRGVAEILALIAAREADAVCLERVVGVFDFAKRAVNIGQRQRREDAEPTG